MILTTNHLQLSATDLANHLGCRHLTSLDRLAATGHLETPYRDDSALEVLQQRGREHEKAYVEHLRAEDRTVHQPAAGETTAFDATVAAMRSGIDVMVQATLQSPPWRGVADILLRVDTPSDLVPYSYEVVDTKLGRTTRPGTVLQLYNAQVVAIEERPPNAKVATVEVPGPGSGRRHLLHGHLHPGRSPARNGVPLQPQPAERRHFAGTMRLRSFANPRLFEPECHECQTAEADAAGERVLSVSGVGDADLGLASPARTRCSASATAPSVTPVATPTFRIRIPALAPAAAQACPSVMHPSAAQTRAPPAPPRGPPRLQSPSCWATAPPHLFWRARIGPALATQRKADDTQPPRYHDR